MKLNIGEVRPVQVIAGAAAVLLLVGGVKIMKGFNPQPDPPGVWGMVGVTPSDTIRINVVNMQFSAYPPGPCSVAMKFLDPAGKILHQQTFTINSTQSASLDYTPVGTSAFRTEVHPVVAIPSTEPTGCSAVGSVEVFDTNSGETKVYANPIYITLPETTAATSRQ